MISLWSPYSPAMSIFSTPSPIKPAFDRVPRSGRSLYSCRRAPRTAILRLANPPASLDRVLLIYATGHEHIETALDI